MTHLYRQFQKLSYTVVVDPCSVVFADNVVGMLEAAYLVMDGNLVNSNYFVLVCATLYYEQ